MTLLLLFSLNRVIRSSGKKGYYVFNDCFSCEEHECFAIKTQLCVIRILTIFYGINVDLKYFSYINNNCKGAKTERLEN